MNDVPVEEEDEAGLPPKDIIYTINNYGADFLVDGLVNRLSKGDIYRPDFQRKFVWKREQASRFIESILLGLPIPGIFLYKEEKTNKNLIIDGLQRLTTIAAFSSGKYPESNDDFKLEGIKSRFAGLSIESLDENDKRRFFDTAIHATIIQQLTPEKDKSSAYYIFERLNTGGTPLQPQEIRSALFHGAFQEFLEDLNKDKVWRKVFGREHSRAKDQELLLRFFAFRNNRSNYVAPLKDFLSDFMEENRHSKPDKLDLYRKQFVDSLYFISSCIEKPFRPVRNLNAAAFDAILVIVSENMSRLKKDKVKFSSNYFDLMKDPKFIESVRRSTADEQSVIYRYDVVYNHFVK